MATGPQDYPDFTRFSQAAATPIINQALSIASGISPQLGPFYVGNVPALILDASVTVNTHLQLLRGSFDDTGGADPVIIDWNAAVVLGGALRALIPVTGNFFRLVILVNGGAVAGATIPLKVAGIGITSPRSTQVAHGSDGMFTDDPAVAGGGGSVTHVMPRTIPGKYRFFMVSGATPSTYNIAQQTADGVWSTIAQAAVAGNQVEDFVNLAPLPTRYTLTNTSAGATELVGSLLPEY